jgi:hypothetical protein
MSFGTDSNGCGVATTAATHAATTARISDTMSAPFVGGCVVRKGSCTGPIRDRSNSYYFCAPIHLCPTMLEDLVASVGPVGFFVLNMFVSMAPIPGAAGAFHPHVQPNPHHPRATALLLHLLSWFAA